MTAMPAMKTTAAMGRPMNRAAAAAGKVSCERYTDSQRESRESLESRQSERTERRIETDKET